MATDWAADVKKYVADADDAAIAGIVRYCGIALRNRDSQLVAFSDKTELDRVRNNYLKKKLGLTQSDAALDKAIAKVGEVMKADRTKNRVTVYYLLAAEFKKLGLFVKKAAEKAPTKALAAKADAKASAKKAAPNSAAKTAGSVAAVAGAANATKAAAKKAPAAKAPAKAAADKPVTKVIAAPKKAAATKAAAPKKVAPLKATPAKAKGLVDKAADVASDASKIGTAAVAGTVAAAGAAGAAAVAAASNAAEAAKDTAAKAVGAAGDAAGAVTGAAGAAADKAGALFSGGGQAAGSSDEDSGLGWLWWLLGLGLVALLIWWLLSGRTANEATPAVATTEAAAGTDGAAASGAAVDLASAPAEGSAEIPAGAGVTSELRDGKPVVKVYFDTAKTDVATAFGGTAAGLKAYLAANPGKKLAISGYSDPSGNAAANAELSKKRAQAVQAALVSAGIPAESAELVKPAESTDASVPKEAARRVEVTIQ